MVDSLLFVCFLPLQGKKADVQGDPEQKKFDGTGYDNDLVDSLERDIVSRNPNVHWYGGTLTSFYADFCFVLLADFSQRAAGKTLLIWKMLRSC